jgi:signal transduction histidine kinase
MQSSSSLRQRIRNILRPPGLRSVLLAQVVLPAVAAVFLTFYGGLVAVERLVEERMKEDIELVARTIRLPVSYSLRNDQPVSLLNALESVFEIGRVYGAYVYNQHGDKIASVGVDSPMTRSTVDIGGLLESRVGDPRGGGVYEQLNGRQLYSYFVPLTDPNGKQAGMLQVTRRFSDFTNYMQALRLRAITAFGLVIAFIVAIILLSHHRAIGRPLRALLQSMDRIGAGELKHRARPGGPKEIVTLGERFNAMLDRIETARREIEDRQKAETELIEQLRENEKLAAIGRLSAGVAHELGTPLSVVDGRARRLAQRMRPDGHAHELDRIRREAQKMSRIVQQLVDFGHGRSSEHRQVAVGRICRSALGGVRELATRHEVSIEHAPADGEIEIHGDALRLEQATANLLRNAIQSTPAGTVRLSVAREAQEVVIRVEDSGEGVPESAREQVFEPFFTTKPVGSGSGLGLSVVRAVSDEHGGRTIVTRSAALGGACFELRLPVPGERESRA